MEVQRLACFYFISVNLLFPGQVDRPSSLSAQHLFSAIDCFFDPLQKEGGIQK